MLDASGEAVVIATNRTIRIVDIILRENGLSSIFVAKYEGSHESNQYFFYRDELCFPALQVRGLMVGSKRR